MLLYTSNKRQQTNESTLIACLLSHSLSLSLSLSLFFYLIDFLPNQYMTQFRFIVGSHAQIKIYVWLGTSGAEQ